MHRMLRRLWQRRKATDAAAPGLDVSSDSWTPPRPTEVASGTDWCGWLQEEEAAVAREPVRPAAPPSRRAVALDLASAAAGAGGEAPPPRRDPTLDGRARIRTPPPTDRRWRDVLGEFAEHLTDEELRIIKEQLRS